MKYPMNCSMQRPMQRLTSVLLASLLVAGCGGGGDSGVSNPPPSTPAAVATVGVTPDAAQLLPPATTQLTAVTKDASGNVLTNRAIAWSSSAPAVASVSTLGLVTALTPGSASIVATSEGQSGSATITVIAPVASVTLDATTASLVPAQTLQLTATAKDAAGAALSGRPIAWSTSAATTATVSTAGLVTAVGPGSATITATSEGKSATATVTVAQGALIGTAGGSVVAADSSVRIDVPAGVASDGTPFAITAVPEPAPAPAGGPLTGTYYHLTPEGAHFATPVTITMRYDPAALETWVIPSDLDIMRWDGTQWSVLTDITIDTVAHTVSGKTSGFSTIARRTRYPIASVTPGVAQVNYQQRSVVFKVNTSPPRPLFPYQFKWTTTGANGTLAGTTGSSQQYVATTTTLPTGVIDKITVDVYALGTTTTGTPIATMNMDVTSNLAYTVAINPYTSTPNFEETRKVTVEIRDQQGRLWTPADPSTIHYVWMNTAYAGKWSTPNGIWQVTTNTYTAGNANQMAQAPPRADQVIVDVLQDQVVWNFSNALPTYKLVTNSIGKAFGFMEVGNKQYAGRFGVTTVPSGGGSCVYADIFLPKVPGATSYTVLARDFNDPGGYGTSYTKTFTGATGTGIGAVQDQIIGWRISLDGGCAQSATAVQFRQNLYATRFAGIAVELTVLP
ncbi:MAG: Ig-like domain-containing protein [Gemmatimonadota bacterium]